MPYNQILTQAAKLVWKFKILWFFGLLASCSSGAARLNPNFDFPASDFTGTAADLSEQMRPMMDFLNRMINQIGESPWAFFGTAALVICGLSLITWLIGIYGRTGLALGAWQGSAGAPGLDWEALNQGTAGTFWRVAGISLLVGLPGAAVSLLFAAITAFSVFSWVAENSFSTYAVLLCLGLPLLCLMVPVFWALGILSELATVAAAGEGLGVMAGLRRAWDLFAHNLGGLLLMGLLVLILQIAAGVVLTLILAPLGIGALLMNTVLDQPLQTNLAMLLGLGLLLLPIWLAFSAVLNAYIGALWALTFRHLAIAALPFVPPPPASYYPPPAGFQSPPSI
jgi:hypothetical protein